MPRPEASIKRPHIVAGVVLALAGALGVAQLFLPWSSAAGVSVNGLTIYEQLGKVGSFDTTASVMSNGILAAAIVGGVLLGLAVVCFVPLSSHRIVGVIALVGSLVTAGFAAYLLIQSHSRFDGAGVGYYVYLSVGIVGLIGAIIATVRGPATPRSA